MSHKKNKNLPNCLNCHLPLSEFDSFCPNCGQKPTDGKVTLHDLLHEFIHTNLHLDGKLFTTIRHIFVPGKLTLEFFRGHHKRYAHPIQLYVVLGALTAGVLLNVTRKAEDEIIEKQNKKVAHIQREIMVREVDSLARNLGVRSSAKSAFADSLVYKLRFPDFQKDLRKMDWEIADATFDLYENEDSLRDQYKNHDAPSPVQIVDSQRIRFENRIIDLKQLKDIAATKNDSLTSDGNPISDMKRGWEAGDIENKLRKIRRLIGERYARSDIKIATDLSKEDSTVANQMSFFMRTTDQLKFSNRDLYELPDDSLLAMAQPKSWFEKIYFKQAIKMKKSGDSMLHYYFGKLLWIITITIPIVALWFQLLYRRQKRYYVEHIIFLLHCGLALFIGGIAASWLPEAYEDYAGWIFLWLVIHFFLAMKNYYGQGWRKTFVKFLSVSFIYFILLFTIGALLFVASFFLF